MMFQRSLNLFDGLNGFHVSHLFCDLRWMSHLQGRHVLFCREQWLSHHIVSVPSIRTGGCYGHTFVLLLFVSLLSYDPLSVICIFISESRSRKLHLRLLAAPVPVHLTMCAGKPLWLKTWQWWELWHKTIFCISYQLVLMLDLHV